MTDSTSIIAARGFIDPQGSIVESARLLGLHVQQHARQADEITISFVGVKGLSSSYFNMLLRMLLNEFGLEGYCRRVHCDFDSPLQKSVYERSWQAISEEATWGRTG